MASGPEPEVVRMVRTIVFALFSADEDMPHPPSAPAKQHRSSTTITCERRFELPRRTNANNPAAMGYRGIGSGDLSALLVEDRIVSMEVPPAFKTSGEKLHEYPAGTPVEHDI